MGQKRQTKKVLEDNGKKGTKDVSLGVSSIHAQECF